MPNQSVEDRLVVRYLNRGAGPTETADLEAWLASDPANVTYFVELYEAWWMHYGSNPVSSIDSGLPAFLEKEWAMRRRLKYLIRS